MTSPGPRPPQRISKFISTIVGAATRLFRRLLKGAATTRPETYGAPVPRPPLPEIQATQPPGPAIIKTKPVIIIALDYGTFSTKVLVRRRGDQHPELLTLNEAAAGYPEFAIPSVVRISGDRVYYGGQALLSDDGNLYRWLKIRIIQPNLTAIDGEATNHFQEVDAPALVAAYLTWVLSLVKIRLDSRFGDSAYRPVLNLAAPMDHLVDRERQRGYLRIAATAWNSVFEASTSDVLPSSDAACVVMALSERLKAVAVPTIEERPFQVLPENLAPLVSLAQKPQMRPGMYLVVDVGAGTTEFSINKVQSTAEQLPVLCYCDRSVLIGARSFATADGTASVCESLLCEARRTWGQGFEKVKNNFGATKHWRQLNILLAGGGSQHPLVQRAFKRNILEFFYPWAGQGNAEIHIYEPGGIQHRPADSTDFRKQAFLLAVAHGLSVERQQWPQFVKPFEIEPTKPTPEKAKGYGWQDDPGS